MKTIILNVDNLRERVSRLRHLQSQYEHCQGKLHQVCSKIQEVYLVDFSPMVDESLDLSPVLKDMADKTGKLAMLLEQRANEIEDENRS